MKNLIRFNRNKVILVLSLVFLVSLFIGVYFYIKIKDVVDINQINLFTVIKNNSIIHVIIVLLIFLVSFLLLGHIFGMFAFIYELVCLTVLGIFLVNKLSFFGIFTILIFVVFKIPYFVLLFYLITRCFKIAKSLYFNKLSLREYEFRNVNQALITSLIIIVLELFNYFVGYKIMGIFAF